MAQHDYVIANGTGAAVRSDLNNALAAIVSQNSGATEPTTTYAYMPWADTGSSPPVFKIRNAANNGWITLYQLDGEWSTIALENGTAGAPSLYFKDSGTDTGFYSPGADQVAVTTAGVQQLLVDSYGANTSGGGVFRGGVSSYAVNGGVIEFSSPYTDIRACRSGGNYAGMRFFTQGANSSGAQAERMSITTEGLVGIGTTSPSAKLTITETGNVNSIVIRNADTNGSILQFGVLTSVPAAFIQTTKDGSGTEQPLAFYNATSETARIDTSGRLLVGTSTSAGDSALVQIRNNNGQIIEGFRSSNDANGPVIYLTKSRGTEGSPTEVSSGDILGLIDFKGYDGAQYRDAAYIYAIADGTWTDGGDTTDNPGALVFSTTADGGSSPTERMRIDNSGNLLIRQTTVDNTSGGAVFYAGGGANNFELYLSNTRTDAGGSLIYLNRHGSDGNLIVFRQANTDEGIISVSGTAVTYGGGHLARWSQLPNAEDPSSLLRGTVMSNLDEMCEWGEEDNEQLNKTKVSDVEGDPNVAGVFVSTSFDDVGPLDFFVGMTGDMIIRIAEGVTVQRGDLLMSAGDGTAKPQDDDIVRSKTVAKVTSTHVTCTYDDGSYCVPCVLMAC